MPLAAAAAAFRWAITCDVLAGTTPQLPLLSCTCCSPVLGNNPPVDRMLVLWLGLQLVAAKAPVAIELAVTEVAAIAAVGLLHKVSDCCAGGCCCCCCCCCSGATVVGVCNSGSPLAIGDVLPETLPSPPLPLSVAAVAATVTLDGELQSGELGSQMPTLPPPPPPPGVPPPPPPACGNAEFCCGSAASLAINTVDCGEEKRTENRECKIN